MVWLYVFAGGVVRDETIDRGYQSYVCVQLYRGYRGIGFKAELHLCARTSSYAAGTLLSHVVWGSKHLIIYDDIR